MHVTVFYKIGHVLQVLEFKVHSYIFLLAFCLQSITVFKWLKVVRLPNGLVFECHWNTGHLNTGQVKVCYSVVSVIPMLAIQIHTIEYIN